MADYASYGGQRIQAGSITIPTYGAWSADLTFAEAATVPTTGVIAVGDLSLTGYVFRSRSYAGHRAARLGGGYGGWRQQVSARVYHLPVGIPLALVLSDVASAVGEKVNVTDVGTIGGYYVRDAGPASRVLRQLAGPIWYVDVDGTTRVHDRPTGAITSPFLVTSYDPAAGIVTVATEHLSEWMPGRTLNVPQIDATLWIQSTTIRITNDGTLRIECLTRDESQAPVDEQNEPTSDDRLMAAIRQIIRSELPRGVYNQDSAVILDGGTGTSEHVASVEGTIAILAKLLPLLPFIAPMLPPAADAAIAGALAGAQSADLTSVAPLSFAASIVALGAKRKAGDDANGTQPGVGCAEVLCG